MVIWKEIENINLDLSYLTDDAIIKMLKMMSVEDKQKLIDAVQKEIKENKAISRSMELAVRILAIAITTLI
jgi:uncharacterized protein YihD (DUF1040 family)